MAKIGLLKAGAKLARRGAKAARGGAKVARGARRGMKAAKNFRISGVMGDVGKLKNTRSIKVSGRDMRKVAGGDFDIDVVGMNKGLSNRLFKAGASDGRFGKSFRVDLTNKQTRSFADNLSKQTHFLERKVAPGLKGRELKSLTRQISSYRSFSDNLLKQI